MNDEDGLERDMYAEETLSVVARKRDENKENNVP